MNSKRTIFLSIALMLAVCLGTSLQLCAKTTTYDYIKYNQVGFYPDQEKEIIIEDKAGKSYTLTDANGKKVASGKSKDTRKSPFNAKQRSIIDLSSITAPGQYTLTVGKNKASIIISEKALSALETAAIKAFYYQRSGMAIDSKYAGQWNRKAAHLDTKVMIHPSAATAKRPAGTIISSSKGWYDAGDYNKYVVNGAFSVALMLNAYSENKDYFDKLNLNIPESGKGLPDILAEIKYELDWLLTMQDPNDGGVYHKLTTPTFFKVTTKPSECDQQRYVIEKTTAATLDFAAVMAQASEIYFPYDSQYAQTMLKAAALAWEWAENNPKVYYDQTTLNEKYDPDIKTGTYADNYVSDEWFWAATTLYLSTNESKYYAKVTKYKPKSLTLPNWSKVSGLGCTAWAFAKNLKGNDAEIQKTMQQYIIAYAEKANADLYNSAFNTPYGNTAKDFFWGCNCDKLATQGIYLLQARKLALEQGKTEKAKEFLTNACRDADYLLGRNATGYCYVTGFGGKSPQHPHHSLSASDGIMAPIPGFMVGGPNPSTDESLKSSYMSDSPDESYTDDQGNSRVNEIAINWNASLVAFIGSLCADYDNIH